jgi:hypothetical protein
MRKNSYATILDKRNLGSQSHLKLREKRMPQTNVTLDFGHHLKKNGDDNLFLFIMLFFVL